MDDDVPSRARALAAAGWLMFGFSFTAALGVAALHVHGLSWICMATAFATTVMPVIALGWGVLDLVRGRAGASTALIVSGLHLLTVLFVGGVLALIVSTSRH